MTLPKTPWPLVLVQWEDSQQPHAAWEWVDDYQEPNSVFCISIGWLIAESKTTLALAPNIADLDQSKQQTSGVIRIPKRSVIRRQTIRRFNAA